MVKKCIWCGAFLVDTDVCITPDGNEISYYKAIALKYCDKCREKAYKQGDKLRLYNFRQRQKQQRKQDKQELEALRKEKELLRQQIMRMREEISR